MVQIWQMESYPCGDPRLPHHIFPPKNLTPDELTKRSGAQIWKLDVSDPIALARRITLMKMEKAFGREDIFTLDGNNSNNFRDKVEELFEETEMNEDQAKMIIEGQAYFDVEDKDGHWLRILCETGDLLLIPAHKLFRFTTTPKNYVKIRRFYKD